MVAIPAMNSASEASEPDVVPSSGGSPLERVYRRHRVQLVRLASLVVRDPGIAEEVVQEAVAKTMVARRAPEAEDQLHLYLVRAVINTSKRTVSRLSRERSSSIEALEATAVKRCVSDVPEDSGLLGLVSRLPKRQREVVILRYWLGYGVEETSEALGISAGSTKQHAFRAIVKLRDALGEDE